MMRTSGKVTDVGVLDKGVAIIDLCDSAPSTAGDIARELGMTVPTAHRLTSALTTHNLLARDNEGRFHPGTRFTDTRLDVVSRPVLYSLTDEIQETSQLWVRRGSARVCAVSVVASRELRVELGEGSRISLEDGGSAVPVLTGELPSTGWVESVSQRTPGVCSVSAPVFAGGAVVAAVCIVVPVSRVDGSPGEMYGTQAITAAAEITAVLDR